MSVRLITLFATLIAGSYAIFASKQDDGPPDDRADQANSAQSQSAQPQTTMATGTNESAQLHELEAGEGGHPNAAGEQGAERARLAALGAKLESLTRNAPGSQSLDELSALAGNIETLLDEMRQINRKYSQPKKEIEQKYFDNSADISALLGYLVTLEAASTPIHLLHPEGALGAARANQLVDHMLPILEARISEVSGEMARWREFQTRTRTVEEASRTALASINALRRDIIEGDRSHLQKREITEPMVFDALFAVSTSLGDFMSGMAQIPLKGPPPTGFDFEGAAGSIPLPVTGDTQSHRQGVLILTENVFVRAPFPATVRFAASFPDYGNMVILEPKRDILVVLAGMDRIVANEGDMIEAGDVVGFFTDSPKQSDANDNSLLDNAQKSLYVEARISGKPVRVQEYFSRQLQGQPREHAREQAGNNQGNPEADRG